ncbi:hypothetical protein ACBJ59_10540 [Nonomuraea sp. MTCD27]|uniref:hypothetical protein n=1 Tax=Nonomuraea sp. MTCD27 TaxID=1676747 RepID=UPI0035C085C7
MDSSVVVAIVVGLSGIVGAWFSARAATKAAMRKTDSEERVALQQIEAGAFGRAKEFYESTLAGMKAELTRQAQQMQREIDQQAVQIGRLQRKVNRQERIISAWGDQITRAGLVPVSVPDDSP